MVIMRYVLCTLKHFWPFLGFLGWDGVLQVDL